MKPTQLTAEIIARFTAKVNRPVYVEGSPGIGKTEIVAQAAARLGIAFKVIHAPLLQPEDYGFPVIGPDKKTVDFVVSTDKFPLIGSDCDETGLFLIDELSQADQAAQKILSTVLHEKQVHGKRLKPGWMVLATGNRTMDRAGANRILSHLGNRVTRVTLDPSLDDWTSWALAAGVRPEVIAFIRFRPELLSNFDPNEEVNATPRAWTQGVSVSLGVSAKETEFEVFKGDVGEGPAAEFSAFLRIYRELPSPDAILLDPAKAKVPKDPATVYAICGALAHRAAPDNFQRLMIYIKRLPAEFAVLFVRDSLAKSPAIATSPDFIAWAAGDGAKLLA